MGVEIEAKLPVPALDPVRLALADVSATLLARVVETNHIYDSSDGRLHRNGSALRLRINTPTAEGEPTTVLTFKGPVEPGSLKRRREVEVAVGDAAAALDILAALGFIERLVYRKRRESYRLDDCRVELDEVPHLGCFVEIEGPNEESIGRVQGRIGLADIAHQHRSYVALLADHCERTGLDPRAIDFPTL